MSVVSHLLHRKTRAQRAFRGNRGCLFNFTNPQNLFSDAAGSVPVVDADGIYWARDLSGNGNDLSQATSGSRPAWSVNGYATFDGTADHLFRATDMRFSEQSNIREQWTFMAMASSSPGTSDYIFNLGNTSGTSVVLGIGSNSTTASTLSIFVRDDSSTNALAISTARQTGVFNGSVNTFGLTCEGPETSCNIQAYINGIKGTRSTGGNYSGAHTFNCVNIGALKRTTVTDYIAMNLYHLLFIDRILPISEMQAIEQEWRRQAKQ